MASLAEPSAQTLADLLLDFARAPGKYPVRLGEPRLLYAQLDTVATWALGRVPAEQQEQAQALAEAAVLFVLRACFAAGHTHYQVLGLEAEAITPEVLRARYRALIRLTHPDMAVQGLPANAAGIVNRANEVLSDEALRRAYDEKLAELDVSTDTTPRVRPSIARIEHHVGWGERLGSLAARYPAQVRVVGVAGMVALVTVALLLWAVSDGDKGRMLVVAEAPSPLGEPLAGGAERSAKPSAAARAGNNLAAGARYDGPALPPAAALPRAATSPRPDQVAALQGKEAPELKVASAPAPPPIAWSRAEVVTSTLPAPAPARNEPAPVASSEPAQRPVQSPAQPQPVAEATRVAAALTVLPPARAPAVVLAPAPQPSSPPPALPAPVAAPAPASPPPPVQQAAAGRIWPVDPVGSLDYLTELIGALEQPAKARQANRYLASMKVQGSLLQPALQLMAQYPTINVEKMDWSDTERPGVLNVRGTVLLQARGRQDSAGPRWVRYRLSAEFWGTRDGTVLAVLDLKEND